MSPTLHWATNLPHLPRCGRQQHFRIPCPTGSLHSHFLLPLCALASVAISSHDSKQQGWGRGLVTEYLPTLCKALGSIPALQKKRDPKQREGVETNAHCCLLLPVPPFNAHHEHTTLASREQQERVIPRMCLPYICPLLSTVYKGRKGRPSHFQVIFFPPGRHEALNLQKEQ